MHGQCYHWDVVDVWFSVNEDLWEPLGTTYAYDSLLAFLVATGCTRFCSDWQQPRGLVTSRAVVGVQQLDTPAMTMHLCFYLACVGVITHKLSLPTQPAGTPTNDPDHLSLPAEASKRLQLDWAPTFTSKCNSESM